MARIILKHTLIGLAFLHKNDIVHADLQPGNILPATSEIDALCEDDLKQDQSGQDHYPKPLTLQRIDGLEDIWAPRRLYLDQSLLRYTPIDSRMLWKISDFGSAFLTQTPPKAVVTPDALRAPELILGGVVNSSIDIWSFGCLVYEFLTGDTLFCVPKLGPNEEESGDDDHLLQMNDILGPLPEAWLKHKWPRANQYFGPNRERLDPNAGQNAGYQQEPYIDEPLELLFEKNKPEDMDGTEASVITSLIRSILQYDPSQRPSAAKLLEHPWFQD
ncbi:hypothetical protein PV08_12077 [Exophiala spinifera]|uniref:Protein kinase domain-containing protein n=1 Tax=Exophiala spinifera TaxID=91928 RepID=A0A0D1Z9L5_9EURO|nr:uncharacterized protein PV08_12077 [Exophiala spinifera]KIW09662.1 hypothetical protein PV08_12077 [Exophiala spinifera]